MIEIIKSNVLDMHNDLVEIYHDKERQEYYNDDLLDNLFIYGITVDRIQEVLEEHKETDCFSSGEIVSRYNKEDKNSQFQALVKLQTIMLSLILMQKHGKL